MWSGGGVDYAQHWVRKLGLDATVVAKGSFKPDIAVDDLANSPGFNLGITNLPV